MNNGVHTRSRQLFSACTLLFTGSAQAVQSVPANEVGL